MASLRRVCEFESSIRQQREVYEAALERARQAQWAAYYAIRACEDVVRLQGSTQALEEARRNEQEARQAFDSVEQARGKPLANCSDWRPYCIHSGQGTFHEIDEIAFLFVFTCLWIVMNWLV